MVSTLIMDLQTVRLVLLVSIQLQSPLAALLALLDSSQVLNLQAALLALVVTLPMKDQLLVFLALLASIQMKDHNVYNALLVFTPMLDLLPVTNVHILTIILVVNH